MCRGYILDDQIQVSDRNYQFPHIGYTLAVQLYEERLKRSQHNIDFFLFISATTCATVAESIGIIAIEFKYSNTFIHLKTLWILWTYVQTTE